MQNKVATQISLVWRSNQVRISKSNFIPQLAEAVIIDRNSKEHLQNEANQKELPQLKKYFTKSKECQVIQFVAKQGLHPNYVCLGMLRVM